MSYMQQFGSDAFFRPLSLLNAANVIVQGEVDIGAASGDHGELICFRQCLVKRVAFCLTSEAASGTSTAPTVIFTKRPTPLSATGEAVIGTLIVPSGSAVGKVIYKDITPVVFQPGDSLEISWTVGVGTPTGIGMWYVECNDDPEMAANQSDMIASA